MAFTDTRDEAFAKKMNLVVYRGDFLLPQTISSGDFVSFLYKCIGMQQSIYINGHMIAENMKR